MYDAPMDYPGFLEIVLEGSDYDWKRFQRPAVRRRVLRLCGERGFRDLETWCDHLLADEEALEELRSLLSVPFSRFFRDGRVFAFLARRLLPELAAARGGAPLRIWSAGCACGQEIWSLAMGRPEGLAVELLASDVNEACLRHAVEGCFSTGTLRECPPELRERYFAPRGDRWALRRELLPPVRFFRHDLLRDPYPDDLDVILCRNAAFTYFAPAARLRVAAGFDRVLRADGAILLGRGETLPRGWISSFAEDPPGSDCHRRLPEAARPL